MHLIQIILYLSPVSGLPDRLGPLGEVSLDLEVVSVLHKVESLTFLETGHLSLCKLA